MKVSMLEIGIVSNVLFSLRKGKWKGEKAVKRKGQLVLLSAAMVFGALFTGCTSVDNDSVESKKVGEVKESSSEGDAEKKDDVSNGEMASAGKEEKYHPGDVVSFGDFEITYSSIKKFKSDNEFIQPKKGFQYIKYVFSFKNKGKKDAFVGDFSCYADGEKCDSAYVDDSDSDLLLTELSAGRKKSGSLVYEVPKKVKIRDLELEYENNYLWSDKKIIFLGR